MNRQKNASRFRREVFGDETMDVKQRLQRNCAQSQEHFLLMDINIPQSILTCQL